MFYKFRLLNKLLAKFLGYFWLPCPICGNYFGGHEWAETLMLDEHRGKGVCPRCAKEARRRNQFLYRGLPCASTMKT